jgi:transcriptional regulator with XRE-family HTH domain
MAPRPRNAEDEAAFKGLGRAIATVREGQGLTVPELAGMIEEEPSILDLIECGKTNADWATLRVIAGALDLSLPVLIELAEELAPGPGGAQWRQANKKAPGD